VFGEGLHGPKYITPVRERLDALHHVTAVCSDARRTVGFYRGHGLELVKKTVNFDDPGSYHLYFGDDRGRPGTLLTFFEWPGARRGRLGAGTLASLEFATPSLKEPTWLEDPDGLRLELVPGERVELRSLTALGDAGLYEELLAGGAPVRFRDPPAEAAVVSAGIVHHHAWRMADEDEQLVWRERLLALGLRPTQVYDRKYFRSIYFRMPDGLLLELATDGPGFGVDEPPEALGEALSLPDWLEAERSAIEESLAPIG
jgi:glyoxalase family protein